MPSADTPTETPDAAPVDTQTKASVENLADSVANDSTTSGSNASDTSISPSRWRRLMRWARGGFWTGLGYMLSPLSWWNDVFFNLPIAYAFGYAVSWLSEGWFIPGTVVGYWLSNVIGIVMMQVGITDVARGDHQRNLKRDILWGVIGSTLYSVIIVLLARWEILSIPDFLPGFVV
ncbi:MAG: hypothetical protein AAF889_06285 [Cyanobacteria bacterium P01_D01_bin.73]